MAAVWRRLSPLHWQEPGHVRDDKGAPPASARIQLPPRASWPTAEEPHYFLRHTGGFRGLRGEKTLAMYIALTITFGQWFITKLAFGPHSKGCINISAQMGQVSYSQARILAPGSDHGPTWACSHTKHCRSMQKTRPSQRSTPLWPFPPSSHPFQF